MSRKLFLLLTIVVMAGLAGNVSAVSYTVTGTATVSTGGNLNGVTITATGGAASNDTTTTTGSDGKYTSTHVSVTSVTITPTKAGYTFNPVNKTYNLSANKTGGDFVGTLNTYTISGFAMVDGVTMSGLPGNPTTSGGGLYSVTVGYGWSGVVTPTKSGYTFSPASITYSNVTADQTCQNYFLFSGLIGWWNFDNNNANDSSGNGFNGALTGNAQIITDGERGKVLQTNIGGGTGDYVDLGTGIWGNPGANMTIMAWFKVNAFTVNYQTVVAKGLKTYRIGRNSASGNKISVYMNYNSGSSQSAGGIGASPNINNGKWHHFAATFDMTSKRVKLYTDGVLDDSSNTMSTLFTSNENLMIGRNNGDTTRDWNGWIDDVRLYNDLESAAAIRAIATPAFNFAPTYGATTSLAPTLQWSSAAAVHTADVYLGTSSALITSRDASTKVSAAQTAKSYAASGLTADTTYYWTVDTYDGGVLNSSTAVMSFVTAKPYAITPSPVDGAKCLPASTSQLSWAVSPVMVTQDVYFGTSSSLVTSKDVSVQIATGNTVTSCSIPTSLANGVTYYWLVDTHTVDGGTATVGTWSFTTIATSDIPSDANLIGWWKFDDDAGSQAWDYSGRGNPGTLKSTTFVDGKMGKALSFSAASKSYVDIPSAAFSSLNKQVTVAFWANGGSALTGSSQTSAFYGDSGTGTARLLNAHLPFNGSVYWDSGYLSSANPTYDRINTTINAAVYKGQWNHWAFTKNTDSGQVKIYLNGALWLSNNASTAPATKPLSGITRFKIGCNADGSTNPWDGKIDDFRVYNRELSLVDVRTAAGLFGAYNLSPANNSTQTTTVNFDWDSVAVSPKYDVYLSSVFADVNKCVDTARVAHDITDSQYQATGLNTDTIYYWAIDVNLAGTMYMSETIPMFTTVNTSATNPSPANGAKYVVPTQLSWTANPIMTSQDVYFSANSALVTSRDASVKIASATTATSVAISSLTSGQTYYWLVDTTSSEGVNSKGVWSFVASAITDVNLIGSWQFEDTENTTTALDSSGYSHGGAFAGGAAIVSDPERGNVATFSGSGQYVDLGSGAWTNPGNYLTIAAWFKVNAWTNGQYNTIFAKGNQTYRLARNTTGAAPGGNQITCNMNFNSGTNAYRSASSTSQVNVGWHHAVTTYDGTTITMYIDGIQESSGTLSTLYTTTANLCIGRNSDQTPRDWNGWVDDVRMYNRALNALEVRQLANNCTAYNLSPADAAVIRPDAQLTWNTVSGSPSCNVYISTTQDDVTARAAGALVSTQSQTSYQNSGWSLGAKYFWAVDIIDGGKTYSGAVMSFTAMDAFQLAVANGQGPNGHSGDMNGDNKLTFDDVIAMAALMNLHGQIIDNKVTIPGDSQYYNVIADADGNGKITFNDLITVVSWINEHGTPVSRKLTIACPHTYGPQ